MKKEVKNKQTVILNIGDENLVKLKTLAILSDKSVSELIGDIVLKTILRNKDLLDKFAFTEKDIKL